MSYVDEYLIQKPKCESFKEMERFIEEKRLWFSQVSKFDLFTATVVREKEHISEILVKLKEIYKMESWKQKNEDDDDDDDNVNKKKDDKEIYIFGFDCEFKRGLVDLIQVSCRYWSCIFSMSAIKDDDDNIEGPLLDFLCDSSVIKMGKEIEGDTEKIIKTFNFDKEKYKMKSFFDISLITEAMLPTFGSLGLKIIGEALLEIKPIKWSGSKGKKELNASFLRYASQDAWLGYEIMVYLYESQDRYSHFEQFLSHHKDEAELVSIKEKNENKRKDFGKEKKKKDGETSSAKRMIQEHREEMEKEKRKKDETTLHKLRREAQKFFKGNNESMNKKKIAAKSKMRINKKKMKLKRDTEGLIGALRAGIGEESSKKRNRENSGSKEEESLEKNPKKKKSSVVGDNEDDMFGGIELNLA